MSETGRENLPVKAVLLVREDRYYFYESGIGVIASGEHIEEAYEKFNHARREYLAQVDDAGLASVDAKSVASFELRQSTARELTLFAAKVCIVLAIIAVVAFPAIVGITRSIEQAAASISVALNGAGSLSLADITRKAADIARDAEDLPVEKKASLQRSVGIISRELAPIVDEWRKPPEAPASPTK